MPVVKSAQEAVDYWTSRVDECELSVDWSEAHSYCWRCGCEKNLQRCHIIPDSLGGKDAPSNIVLLCKRCHEEGPNVEDPEIMWDWIKAYHVPFYETFWGIRGMREYKFLYSRSFQEDLNEIILTAGLECSGRDLPPLMTEKMEETARRCSYHFGQPYFNTATIAGMYRMLIKELAEAYQVPLPHSNTPPADRKPWYLDL